MLKGLCPACLQPFRNGDECKEVGNNSVTMVLGRKSGMVVAVPLSDPNMSVIVHRHCTVQHEDPRSNSEFLEAVEDMRLPEWEKQWKEEWIDTIKSEVYENAPDELKRTCAACLEEIEYMGDDEVDPQIPTHNAPPWGVTS